MTNREMEAAIRGLQDAMVVTAHLEKRQSAPLKQHAAELDELASFRRRTEQNLAEATDKLNALIDLMDRHLREGGERS